MLIYRRCVFILFPTSPNLYHVSLGKILLHLEKKEGIVCQNTERNSGWQKDTDDVFFFSFKTNMLWLIFVCLISFWFTNLHLFYLKYKEKMQTYVTINVYNFVEYLFDLLIYIFVIKHIKEKCKLPSRTVENIFSDIVVSPLLLKVWSLKKQETNVLREVPCYQH